MFSFNRVHIIGYQTQPLTLRQTPGGTSVTDLNLVVPYTFRSDSGEALSGKGFHTVTLWGPMADIAHQYLRPGSQVFISGRLQTDTWEDEATKEKRSKTKIVALDLILLDPKGGQTPMPERAPRLFHFANRADLVGNVTRDPEIRTTSGGQHVLTLGLATNDRWKDKQTGEDRERAEFHSVVVWGDLAEEAGRVLKKGSRAYVSGRMQTRSWETQNGGKRTATEVIAEQVTALGTEHPAAKESIRADAAGAPARDVASADPAAPPTEPAASAGAVPAIEYASEVKVEDLPF